MLRRLTVDPERPYVVVLGGSKVSDKLGVIDNLLGKADRLLIGGGMVFTFLAAQGHEVGKSLLEEDQLDTVRGYLDRAEESGVEIVLPTDIVVDTEFPSDDREPQPRVVPADGIPADSLGLDIGPESATAFAAAIGDAQDGVLERPDGRLRDRRPSPTARGPSRRRSPRSTGCPWSAAATPPRPSASSASTRAPSVTSPPAAAPASSCSRARNCPASRSSSAEPVRRIALAGTGPWKEA